MNERILELAKVAGLKYPSEETLSPVEIKFAELIVRECADIADEYDGVGSTIVSRIKKHFGVEE
jgi:hypothetical protein